MILGTAQFGMEYGVTNSDGRVSDSTLNSILRVAKHNSISMLDTAQSYGNCETRLGSFGVSDFDVISKFEGLPQADTEIDTWAQKSIEESLCRLNLQSLFGLLWHNSADLVGNKGKRVADTLISLKKAGLVKKIGVSIYEPEILESFEEWEKLDFIQAPFSLFDRRLETSG